MKGGDRMKSITQPKYKDVEIKSNAKKDTLGNLGHRITLHLVGLISYHMQTPSECRRPQRACGVCLNIVNPNVPPLSRARYSGLSPGLGPSLRTLPLRGSRFELHLVPALRAAANEIELMDVP